ncbi:putative site-specific DNA-methyltransferase (cytosine-N(4)-specific) [Vibrio crassostreae]|nr:putative site-specific DNA-methyltransferase (cytosine-N(4)-specific) [Vibrio crassostreae]CAK2040886.1 putative site-specific DNA-methyltransferase (cytosine-N(4)-specific) [Vibrio crassostreae]CAK2345399.1 putative site-specific DNA-methyltransferase (cytosine-N(4)-specific) [Vibrio crassostreae]CAK2810143.1 putative site-specific DNA-methyltransferase (cytosine-N(4)-specific) [Vibrio crassostreae]CAK2882741.1 putative site-specific DNA-methyltransferase (cytosine-N(4)-specific) [Vibrio cr
MIYSAKRSAYEKVNVHSWHPYYAGYSECFVNSVLSIESENLTQKSIILDPWVGSGTTGVVCQKKGLNCIGVDINSSMAIFSASKSSKILAKLKSESASTLNRIFSRAKKNRTHYDTSHLNEIMSRSFSLKMTRLLVAIEDELYTDSVRVEPFIAFFKSVLLVSNRQLMGYKSGSNPTWFKKTSPTQCLPFTTIEQVYRQNFYSMLSDLDEIFALQTSDFSVYESSSISMPVSDDSVDLVITSPPYLTRIDYAVSTQVELLLLGGAKRYRAIRENTIGTTTIFSQRNYGDNSWGELCNDVISAINSHPSYSSQNYYIKNKIQYFDSSYQSLIELYRVLKTEANAYLVIQNSYYKEIPIPLPEIYMQMAKLIGFSEAVCERRDVLKTTMAHINAKSKRYEKNKIYYEDVIRLKK